MNNHTTKLCNITSGREEFICLNELCYKQNKKQLHCFECITKLHRKENKNIVQHMDDFKKIDQVMSELSLKNAEKITHLNLQLSVCNDFKKEKFQQIEKYTFNAPEFLEQIKQQVEKEVDVFTSYLGEQLIIFSKLSEYSPQHHTLIMQYYFQTKPFFFDSLDKKKLVMEQKVIKFLTKMDLDLHEVISKQKQKQQQLEVKLSQLSKQSFFGSTFGARIVIIPLVIVLCLSHVLILNEKHKEMSQKLDQFEQYILSVQQEIDTKVQSLRKEFANTVQNKIDSVQGTVNQIEEKLNQTETPYNQFKLFFNNKLQQYNETIVGIIDEKYRVALKSQISMQAIEEQEQKQSEINSKLKWQIENMERAFERLNTPISLREQIINLKDNITVLTETQRLDKQQLSKNMIKIHERTIQSYRKVMAEKLVGKIHIDLPVSELPGFLVVYDELLNRPFNRSIVASIRTQISNETILCIGGTNVSNSMVLNVVACDYPPEIFEFTYHWQHARKSASGDMYWYMAYPVAFGFSPTEEIHLTLCDDLDPTDQRRLSYWFENGADGGRRIGNQTQLVNSKEYKMIMYAL